MIRKMKKVVDLNVELKYKGHPVRVGIIGEDLCFCFSDLLNIVGVGVSSVSHSTKKVPEEMYYRAFALHSANGIVVAITEEGATIALCRLSKVDMMDVIHLLRWMKTVKKEKIRGA